VTARVERGVEALSRYFADIRAIPVLSAEEERELARLYRRTGNPRAAQMLITSNLRFVVRIAREYCSEGRRLADLVQEGNLGLIQAVDRFDPEREVRLVTYAAVWIRARILNHILHTWSLVKLGTTTAQRRLFFSLNRREKELTKQSDPDDPEAEAKIAPMLARCFGVEPRAIEEMRRRIEGRDVSLDAPISDGERSGVECISSGEPQQDDLLSLAQENAIDCQRVRAALGCLDERERLVVELRIMNEPALTLAAVGERLGCGRERARQLEARAMKKLRTCLQSNGEGGCTSSRVVVLRRTPRDPKLDRTG
jgi:RNA polymerase sigma-32 factor